uniref:FxLD family lantipeptide n=1 Tax=Peronospora matthiolae TaxID=2874970 RepID=A0AAV1U250_9STRA
MFSIEDVDPDERDDDEEAENVSVGSILIDVAGIESHICDQGATNDVTGRDC